MTTPTNNLGIDLDDEYEAPKVCNHPLATRPVLYTDTVGGKQTCRDDLWAVTTDELNELHRQAAPEAPTYPTFQHPDDSAVDRFALAMKEKMAASRAKGRNGWDNEALCTAERLQAMLIEHLDKGDPVDIGNFAMMLWNRGERTASSAATVDAQADTQQAGAPELSKVDAVLEYCQRHHGHVNWTRDNLMEARRIIAATTASMSEEWVTCPSCKAVKINCPRCQNGMVRAVAHGRAPAQQTERMQPSREADDLSSAEFLSKRLARVAKLTGAHIPEHFTHEQVAEVAGTILGDIAFNLERAAQAAHAGAADVTPELVKAARQEENCGNSDAHFINIYKAMRRAAMSSATDKKEQK